MVFEYQFAKTSSVFFYFLVSCQTACGYQCKFPFYYKNEKFDGCTTKDNGDEYWCATQLDLTSDSKQWGPCTGICPVVVNSQDRYVYVSNLSNQISLLLILYHF